MREDAPDQSLADGHVGAVFAGADYRVGAAPFVELGAAADLGVFGVGVGGSGGIFIGGDGDVVFEPAL